jgi:hypothetical protein
MIFHSTAESLSLPSHKSQYQELLQVHLQQDIIFHINKAIHPQTILTFRDDEVAVANSKKKKIDNNSHNVKYFLSIWKRKMRWK